MRMSCVYFFSKTSVPLNSVSPRLLFIEVSNHINSKQNRVLRNPQLIRKVLCFLVSLTINNRLPVVNCELTLCNTLKARENLLLNNII